MKTRRGFFSAIAAALSVPFLPKVLAKSVLADAPNEALSFDPAAFGQPFELQPETARALDELNSMMDRWNATPFIGPVYDNSHRYPEYKYYLDIDGDRLKCWPEPPVYPVHFEPWPWEPTKFTIINDTVLNEDGSLTINVLPTREGEQS